MQAVIIHAKNDLRIGAYKSAKPQAGEVLVRIERGGICGSDLHYYHDGGFGTVRVKAPMVLGHEVSGRVDRVGAGVTRVKPGQRVAISPSLPCGACFYCQRAQHNHCLDMRFYGSAMRTPHVDGAFREEVVAKESQCHVVPDDVDPGEAALAEPFAVCLHAAKRAGNLFGKNVLVTGCGPIGVLAIKAAKLAGAQMIVATDVTSKPFKLAQRLGATRTIDVAKNAAELDPYKVDKGGFDCVLECSGNRAAIISALDVIRPRGVFVQVGLGGDVALPMNLLVAKELDVRGTFRFHEEFEQACQLIGSKAVDLKPLITATYPYKDAVDAFQLASDRQKAMKVQLSFDH